MMRSVFVILYSSFVFFSVSILDMPLVAPLGNSALADGLTRTAQAPSIQSREIAQLKSYLDASQKEKSRASNIRVAQNVAVKPNANEQTELQSVSQEDDLLRGPDAQKAISEKEATRPSEKKKAAPGSALAGAKKKGEGYDAQSTDAEHLKLFVEKKFPSANDCGICHPKHYKEWSVSQHAYAQLSPVYLSLNNKINQLSNGSNGDFCLRCHSPVGAALGESSFASNLDRHPTSREGITCIVCHRINKTYNKVSGRLALVEGGVTDPVFGPNGNSGVKGVLAKPDKFRVEVDPKKPGRKIHNAATLFNPIKSSTFCGSCHDVTLFNGFRLEEAFSEYRLSPAAAKGITCQDCHMGKIEGKDSGYDKGPIAVVGDVPTEPKKMTSHFFAGPDYSIIHPGIFPHNQEAVAFKNMREWLQYKHEDGWGTDKFEDAVPAGYKFPKAWESIDDRYDGRQILNKQFELLEYARKKRLEVLRNGYGFGKLITEKANTSGLKFRVQVRNLTDGHNVPTGFTGERLVWLDVSVTDREGTVVFRSGDRDKNGDLRDNHSAYIHAGKAKLDRFLFSLQSRFVTQNGRGGEIEHVIPIPFPSTALPRVLPSTASLVFTGEPATERIHKKSIEPNGHRWAKYEVAGSALTGKGPYRATIKLMEQPAPVNLVAAIQDVGFDYGLTPRQAGDALLAGAELLSEREIVFDFSRKPNSSVPVKTKSSSAKTEPSTPEKPDSNLPWLKRSSLPEQQKKKNSGLSWNSTSVGR